MLERSRRLGASRCEGGSRNLIKRQIVGHAMCPVFPREEQLAVAQRNAGCRVDPEQHQHVVDPVGRPFQLRKIANRSLVQDKMGPRNIGMCVLAPILLVAEGWTVAQTCEDFSERRAVSYFRFRLDPNLIHAGRIFVIRVPLVRDDVVPAILADPQNLTASLQISVRRVVQSVLLKGSGSLKMETRLVKLPFEGGEGYYRDLDFDLGALHG